MSEASSPRDERGRRNVRLALIHALLAAGFLALFVVMQVQR